MLRCPPLCIFLLFTLALLSGVFAHSRAELRAGDRQASARVRDSPLALSRLTMYPSSKVQAIVRSFTDPSAHALPTGQLHSPWSAALTAQSAHLATDDEDAGEHAHEQQPEQAHQPAGQLSESADRLWSHCRALSVVRVADTPAHAAVRAYLRGTLERSALSFEFEERTHTSLTPLGERRFTNLVATYDPTGVASRSRLVLAAHYDSKYFEVCCAWACVREGRAC
jgi:hypothetical protein